MKPRTDSQLDRLKDHHVQEWDKITACGRDSLIEDLSQTLDWDLVNCKKCLVKEPVGRPARNQPGEARLDADNPFRSGENG